MSDQQVKYTITADATQANTELAKVDKAAVSLVGNERALTTETNKATAALKEQGKAATTAATATAKAAGSTRNMGQAALETSRGLEDLQYGIGGVVNNIPSMVMALGGGAGLTAAISLGAVAVNQLAKNFGAVDPAAKEASKKAAEHVKGLRDEIAGLSQDLRSLQVGAERAAMEAQAEVVGRAAQAAQSALEPLGGIDRFERLKDRTDLPLTISENIEKASSAMNELDLEMSKLAGMRRIQVEKDAQRRIDLAVDVANAETERESNSRKSSLKDDDDLAKAKYDIFVAGLDSEDKALKAVNEARRKDAKAQKEQETGSLLSTEEKMLNWVAKMGDEARKHKKENDKEDERAKQLHLSRLEDLEGESLAARMAFDTLAMDHKMENLDKLKAHEFKNLKDTAKQYESMYNDLGALAEGATSTLIGASQDYFKAKIEGAENAEALAAAAFLSGVGEQLVGLGTKNLFEGAGMLIASGGVDPRGYALTALGAGAIAAGVGMGAGSVAITHTAAGGTIGKELPDNKAAKDKGASPGRGGGSSGGGPLVVNVAYGVGGPLPEDTAREISKAVNTGRRRGGR
jgi:hypothetical protein